MIALKKEEEKQEKAVEEAVSKCKLENLELIREKDLETKRLIEEAQKKKEVSLRRDVDIIKARWRDEEKKKSEDLINEIERIKALNNKQEEEFQSGKLLLQKEYDRNIQKMKDTMDEKIKISVKNQIKLVS